MNITKNTLISDFKIDSITKCSDAKMFYELDKKALGRTNLQNIIDVPQFSILYELLLNYRKKFGPITNAKGFIYLIYIPRLEQIANKEQIKQIEYDILTNTNIIIIY